MTTDRDIFAEELRAHMSWLAACRRCPAMQSAPVIPDFQAEWRPGGVLLLGQAPGIREPAQRKLFAWTAGKTLFRWLEEGAGVGEELFRRRVYLAATGRCFPGKAKSGGGDRAPSPAEMANCAPWLERELVLLRPGLILAVGRLAISRFVEVDKLDAVIGRVYSREIALPEDELPLRVDILPLPHPSGASTWHRREPGIGLLNRALGELRGHPVWREVFPEVLPAFPPLPHPDNPAGGQEQAQGDEGVAEHGFGVKGLGGDLGAAGEGAAEGLGGVIIPGAGG
jgi:uracil-DNA glycosylase